MRHFFLFKNKIFKKISKYKRTINCTFGLFNFDSDFSYEIDRKYFLFSNKNLFNKCFLNLNKLNIMFNLIIVDLGYSINQILGQELGLNKKSNLLTSLNLNKNLIQNIKEFLKIKFKKRVFSDDIKYKNLNFKIRNFSNLESYKIEDLIRKIIKSLNLGGELLIICFNFLEEKNLIYFVKQFFVFLSYKKNIFKNKIIYVIKLI
ncbi:hypothetical protein [Candidatus Vidania fulgoroideorum]